MIIFCNFCGVADCQTILSPWPMSVKGPGLNSSPDEEPLDKRTPMPQSIADPLITLRAVYGQRFSCLWSGISRVTDNFNPEATVTLP